MNWKAGQPTRQNVQTSYLPPLVIKILAHFVKTKSIGNIISSQTTQSPAALQPTDPLHANLTYLFAIHLNVCDVVLKHGGHVHFRELVLAEDDQKARFTTGSVAHDHQLLAYGRHPGRICKIKPICS